MFQKIKNQIIKLKSIYILPFYILITAYQKGHHPIYDCDKFSCEVACLINL